MTQTKIKNFTFSAGMLILILLSLVLAIGAIVCFMACTGEPCKSMTWAQEFLYCVALFAGSLLLAGASFGSILASANCACRIKD